jgi:hypothetical protein
VRGGGAKWVNTARGDFGGAFAVDTAVAPHHQVRNEAPSGSEVNGNFFTP